MNIKASQAVSDQTITHKVRRPRLSPEEQLSTIRFAVLALLKEVGFERLTMSALASKAKMSKETLYSRFTSKEQLLANLIEYNARALNTELTKQFDRTSEPFEKTLERIGAQLLSLLCSEESIVINRVAIALAGSNARPGELLLQHGRQKSLPYLIKFIEQASKDGVLQQGINTKMATETFASLLIGDLQIRRLLGVIPTPTPKEIETKAKQAVAQLMRLYGM